jgi:hypothetical protein
MMKEAPLVAERAVVAAGATQKQERMTVPSLEQFQFDIRHLQPACLHFLISRCSPL